MKKIKLALLALGISIFASCSGDVVENVGISEETTKAKLNVNVRDAITGLPISDAEVSLIDASPATTDEDGLVSFKDVRIGTHIVRIEKSGYASFIYDIEITDAGVAVNATVGEAIYEAKENSLYLPLFPVGETDFYGYIYYQDNKGNYVPAKDVEVFVELPSYLSKRVFSASTNGDGKFELKGELPAGVDGRIWAVPPSSGLGGVMFETLSLGELSRHGDLTGGNIDLGIEYFNQNNVTFEATYNKTVKKDGDIVFNFTEDIDQNYLRVDRDNESVKVTSSNVAVDIKWNGRKLTISPKTEWKGNVTVAFDLRSTSGQYYNKSHAISLVRENLSAEVVSGLFIVDADSVDYDTDAIKLRWDLVEGATAYRVYYKEDKEDTSYTLWTTVSEVKGATIGSTDFTLPGWEIKGRTINFIVQAVNEISVSKLDPDEAVEVRDVIAPKLVGKDDWCLYFSEPINEEKIDADPDADDLWISNNQICIFDAVSRSTKYTISGIQDQWGNKYKDGKETLTIQPTP